MRVFVVAFLLALIAGPALAQGGRVQQYREEEKEKTEVQKAEDRRAERAYQRSLGNVPDQKPADPWGIARDDATKKPATPSGPAAKQSSKAKTNGSTNQTGSTN